MAADMFLKLDSIKGETEDAKHKEEIEIESWQWGVVQPASAHSGSGNAEGKAEFHDITVTKRHCASSPILYKFCGNGKHIPSGTLVCRKAGEKPLEYIVIKMTDIIISSITTAGAKGDVPMDTMSLNFAEVDMDYTPQNKDGTGKAKITYGRNIRTNLDK
jgi:type VI secretion system secreted protein Hcp